MDFFDNVVKSSNALIKEKLNNPFGSKQQANEQDQSQPQQSSNISSDQPTSSLNNSTDQPDAPGNQQPDQQQSSPPAEGQNKNSQFAAIAADAEVVTQKAVKGAKDFGSFLFSMGNKAAQTVSQTAKQVKQAVENTSILTDFTREQQEFIKEHGGSMQAGELPWANCENETKAADIREQVLSLSQDRRNFVRSPPNDANFKFEAQQCYPIALSLLKEDPNLSKMRFELVPKLVNEDTFWRNYFYRVSLLKQMSERGEDIKRQGWASSRSSSGEGPDELTCNTIDQDNNQEPTSPSYDTSAMSPTAPAATTSITGNTTIESSNIEDQISLSNQPPQQASYDFSSTNFDTATADYSTQNIDSSYEGDKLFSDDDDLKNKLRELNIGSLDGQDDENAKWEEELQKDLQEFELVSGEDVDALADEELLDNEISELNKTQVENKDPTTMTTSNKKKSKKNK